MAITGDVLITCDDKTRRAGSKTVYMQHYTNITSFTAGSDHEYTGVTMDTTADKWFEIGNDFETIAIENEGNRENGSSISETSITIRVPKMEKSKGTQMQKLFEGCEVVVIIEDYNGNAFVHGWSELMEGDAALLASISEIREAELNGYNGYEIVLTGKTEELAREFTGTIQLNQGSIASW